MLKTPTAALAACEREEINDCGLQIQATCFRRGA